MRSAVIQPVDFSDEENSQQQQQGHGDSSAFAPVQMLPGRPGFDLERTLRHMAAQRRDKGWDVPSQTVTFERLTVTAERHASYIQTVTSTFTHLARKRYAVLNDGVGGGGKMYTKLQDISGYCRPGEMLLVLGAPGSGCSTLLRVLAGQRSGMRITSADAGEAGEGPVRYNGSAQWGPAHPVLIGEEDFHLPQLTVEETMRFAAELAVPLDYPLRKDLDREVHLALHLLGLHHLRDRQVGGDGMCTGIGAGERRRLTIGEMLTTRRSRIMCLDGWSTGIDGPAALELIRTARVIANASRYAVIVSQHQVSDEIFALFDNVLILSRGRQVFFGPVGEALPYCESLGLRKPPLRTVPDFLATLADCSSELAAGAGLGRGEPGASVPKTADDFASAFSISREASHLRATLQELREQQPVDVPVALSRETASALSSSFATPFLYQLGRLVRREVRVNLADRKQLVWPRLAEMAVMALVLGLLFFQLPLTRVGSYTRSGLLYQQLNFLSFSTFPLLPIFISQRRTLVRQRDARLVRPVAWFLAKLIADLPLHVLEAILFGSVIYWLAGLYAAAGHFAFHVLVLFLLATTVSVVVRVAGCVAPDVLTGQVIAGGFVVFSVFFSGFMVPKASLPVYWSWAYWASPMQYALHAMLINEFYPLTFHCLPSEMLPPAAVLAKLGVTNSTLVSSYQACRITGYPTGPRTGVGYVYAAFKVSGPASRAWVDVGALLGMLFFFVFAGAVVLTKLPKSTFGTHLRFKDQVKSGRGNQGKISVEMHSTTLVSVSASDEGEADGSAQGALELSPEGSGYPLVPGDPTGIFMGSNPAEVRLSWSRLTCDAPVRRSLAESLLGASSANSKPHRVSLLQDVHGVCGPRQMVAVIGPAGCGKTALLEALAQRLRPGVRVTGDVRVNGSKLPPAALRRALALAERDDCHQPRCTVRESLNFAANLRLPLQAQAGNGVRGAVDRVLDLLSLRAVADALVGDDETNGGIPSDARRRLTIGVEMVANPAILLLDEPTSGLDAGGALSAVRALRRFASPPSPNSAGRCVVCALRRPSAELFAMFDLALVLTIDGRVAYFGPVCGNETVGGATRHFSLVLRQGRNASEAEGGEPPHNPADFIIEAVSGRNDIDWAHDWRESAEGRATAAQAQVSHAAEDSQASPLAREYSPTKYPGRSQQLSMLLVRTWQVFWRTPTYNLSRHLTSVNIALLLGSAYFQLGDTQSDLQLRVSSLFFSIFLGASAMLGTMVPLFTERAVFRRERLNGSYGLIERATAYGLVEVPFVLVATLVFIVPFYWMAGMPTDAGRFFFAALDYFALQLLSVYFGQAMAVWSHSLQSAMGLSPVFVALWMLHVGFLIPEQSIPSYFKFINVLNPYKYFLRSFVATSLHGQSFRCTDKQYLLFKRPPYGCPKTPVAQWGPPITGPYCRLCAVISGEAYLSFYGWDYNSRWNDLGLLVAFLVGFRVLTYLAPMRR